MKIGLFTPLFNKLTLDELLAELQRYPEIRSLELGTGGWPGSAHVDTESLLARGARRNEFLSKLNDQGLEISALSCHSNPVHPREDIAQRDDELLRRTIRLAELLGVRTVVTFSGCPGGAPEDVTP